MNQLDQIELRIKKIVENSSDLLPWTDHTANLVRHFCESLTMFLLESPDCMNQAPLKVRIYLSPEDMRQWNCLPMWQSVLLDAFTESVVELNCKPDLMPELIPMVRNSLENGEIVFTIEESSARQEITGVVNLSNPVSLPKQWTKNESAMVLIDLEKSIPVDKSVINLGRKSSNDIIIGDLRVSRFHAQIRKTKEGYMIFDVGSTGGTYVNAERITRHLLKSGDVISLAGYSLIFTNEKEQEALPDREITSDLTNIGGVDS